MTTIRSLQIRGGRFKTLKLSYMDGVLIFQEEEEKTHRKQEGKRQVWRTKRMDRMDWMEMMTTIQCLQKQKIDGVSGRKIVQVFSRGSGLPGKEKGWRSQHTTEGEERLSPEEAQRLHPRSSAAQGSGAFQHPA